MGSTIMLSTFPSLTSCLLYTFKSASRSTADHSASSVRRAVLPRPDWFALSSTRAGRATCGRQRIVHAFPPLRVGKFGPCDLLTVGMARSFLLLLRKYHTFVVIRNWSACHGTGYSCRTDRCRGCVKNLTVWESIIRSSTFPKFSFCRHRACILSIG